MNNALDELKREAAKAAIKYVVPGAVLGVGTGSTANHFIAALAPLKDKIPAAVASSQATAERLKSVGIAVVDLEEVREIPIYVDGADEIDGNLVMIKGGGGALTREKIVADAALRFICIVDESKKVARLGAFPLPLEIIALARGPISRALAAMGGKAMTREGFITDNGNLILDVHGLNMDRPVELEEKLNQLPGLVAHGLFARRRADVLLLATASGVKTMTQNELS